MSRLLEIWGDTVDSKHLCGALGLGVGIAAPTFLLAELLFGMLPVDPSLARSYALLVGLLGCLLAGVISARLFPPKRVVSEHQATEEGRRAALDEIESEIGPLGDPADLPERVQQELRALDLYDTLAERTHDTRRAPASTEEASA